MARGDKCKTPNATTFVKQFEFPASIKKPLAAASVQPPKRQEQKNYGAWGPVFKDKQNFTDMHFC